MSDLKVRPPAKHHREKLAKIGHYQAPGLLVRFESAWYTGMAEDCRG
jgi:hypothetical protein